MEAKENADLFGDFSDGEDDEAPVPKKRRGLAADRRGGNRDGEGDEDMLMAMVEDPRQRQRGNYDVVEIFSPPRICARAREKKMRGDGHSTG